MGRLTTHVLDTMNGRPGGQMAVSLHRLVGENHELITTVVLNSDGRNPDGPLLDGPAMVRGHYRLIFEVGSYFRKLGADLPDPAFLEFVPVDFGIADEGADYHVPLLVSPWSYSTYRGS